MKRIKTLKTKKMKACQVETACGECQTSCQSACKTSSAVINQVCENTAVKADEK